MTTNFIPYIPYFLMVAMVVINSVVIFSFRRKRRTLDISIPAQASHAKRLRNAIIMLYVQMMVFTVFIWLVLAPALLRIPR
jgi:hypothetical protein